VGTVRWYSKQIYRKLEVHNRTQAVLRAQALGLA
jgi:ATP/maltotriose-dependent transcriptional regulator MalT